MTKYQAFVYYLALQLLSNAQDAEEVTQEVFWRVYRFAKKFRGEAKVKTWLYTIAVNEARNHLRRKGDWLKDHENLDEHELTDDRDPEADYLIQERSTEIQWAIDQLNPTQRMVILMYYKEELSYLIGSSDIHHVVPNPTRVESPASNSPCLSSILPLCFDPQNHRYEAYSLPVKECSFFSRK